MNTDCVVPPRSRGVRLHAQQCVIPRGTHWLVKKGLHGLGDPMRLEDLQGDQSPYMTRVT